MPLVESRELSSNASSGEKSATHCVFKSIIQSFIHFFTGFFNRTLRINCVFHIFDGFVDTLTSLFRWSLFPAGND